MLPNWLLGKSKSKLQEILGGGGGGTDYTAGDGIDISNGIISFDPLTTPAIDPSKVDGLDDDLAALAPKTALSNHNILHNPWFNVNQRNFTSTSSNSQFPADRWIEYANNPNFTITRNSDGTITLDNTNGTEDLMFRQKRTTTYINSLDGMKVTASIMFSDGTILHGTETFSKTDPVPYINNDDFQLLSWPYNQSILAILLHAGKSITIKALKLEVGEISTLHLDPRPEYATELAKCQRYFQRLSGTANSSMIAGYSFATNYARFPLPMPAIMRTLPTLTYSDLADWGVSKNTAANAFTCTSISIVGRINNVLMLQMGKTDSFTAESHYQLCQLTDGAYLDFSAEL